MVTKKKSDAKGSAAAKGAKAPAKKAPAKAVAAPKRPVEKKPVKAAPSKAPAPKKPAPKVAALPKSKSAAPAAKVGKSSAAPAPRIATTRPPSAAPKVDPSRIAVSARPAQQHLTATQIAEFRDALEKKRTELTARLKTRRPGAVQDIDPGDELDVATGTTEVAMETRLMDREAKLLREVERALAKIEDGTYGICEGTDEPISYARLKIRPWTRHSVAYKEELERERRQTAK